jgi:hypothetical protein
MIDKDLPGILAFAQRMLQREDLLPESYRRAEPARTGV